jgi:sulfur carrier protein ThiS
MSGPDNSNEGKDFIEFRRKVRASEALSASMESLLKTLNFNGRISVVVQNGRVLKSGYEEGFFRQREAGSLLAGGTPAEL